MKKFPEFVNFKYPVLLGRHMCSLVDSYRPFGIVKCLHLQVQAVQELFSSELNSSLFPAVLSPALGEGGLKIMTKWINTIYETGWRPKDFTEVK